MEFLLSTSLLVNHSTYCEDLRPVVSHRAAWFVLSVVCFAASTALGLVCKLIGVCCGIPSISTTS